MEKLQELEQLISYLKSIEMAKKHLANVKKRLSVERIELQHISRQLEETSQDVDKLSRLSVKSLFHSFLGNKEEQYELEKQEYLVAVLKYKEHKKTIELLEFEQKVLEEKVQKEGEAKKQLTQYISEREYQIGRRYPQIKDKLLLISKQIDENFAYKREVREAMIVCLKTQEIFNQMVQKLEKARGQTHWGPHHPITSATRESNNRYLDQASELSYKAKQLLLELQDELDDISAIKSTKRWGDFKEFQYFHDIYYDRLISDWMIIKRINSVLNYLKGKQHSLQRINHTLKLELNGTEKAIDYLNKHREEIIVKMV
ncbi:MAG: hypothetical protein AAFV95_06910 [Bacteroidota bacterium]